MTTRTRLRLPLAWLLIGLCTLAASARADEIDRFVAQEQKLYGVPAIVVGVYRDGRLVDQRATGVVDVERDVRAETTHAFEIGSISKQFTAWAILMLVEEGKLALDAPVGRYLPGLPPAWGAPTLHRLLTHTSGLPDLEDAFTYGVYRETPGDDEFLRRLIALPIDFQPGERWAYSNTNYWLLARVIEQVSGQSYADFMQQRIFAPLGMTSTRSALPAQVLKRRAAGYERTLLDLLENRDAIRPQTGRGLGDIVSTVGDMAAWEREQLSPRLVSAASAERARQPVVLNDGKTAPYGYGWETDQILARPTLHHNGQTAGFTAVYVRVPERRLAVVVLTNLYGVSVDSLGVFVAGASDAAVKLPTPVPIADPDPALTARVRRLLDAGATADTDWQASWFTAARWAEIKDSRASTAAFYRRLGPVMSLTRVATGLPTDAGTSTYRVVYGSLSRIYTVVVDESGAIGRTRGQDE